MCINLEIYKKQKSFKWQFPEIKYKSIKEEMYNCNNNKRLLVVQQRMSNTHFLKINSKVKE